jgi:hypothetical protein
VTSTTPRPLPRPRPTDPPTDRRLARLHLRMGQLELARAELEALAGSGHLDDDGLLALGEARWRTGDLPGAGEAAQAYIAAGGAEALAFVIAAEATAAVGRPSEARRLAGLAVERAGQPLDRFFAGISRSLIWPADGSDAGQLTGMLFPAPTATTRGPAAPGEARERPEEPFNPAATGPGFWDAEYGRPAGEPDLPEPHGQIAAAKAAIADGRHAAAAIHLAVALRLTAGLAPTVLELIEASERRTAELELVRGDAYRVVGHELEARRAYGAAAAALGREGMRGGFRHQEET